MCALQKRFARGLGPKCLYVPAVRQPLDEIRFLGILVSRLTNEER